MVLKGQLASDITEVQISGTNSGSPVVDWQGNPHLLTIQEH